MTFTKKDLKSGMVVEVRCGERYLVLADPSNWLYLINDHGRLLISNFNENLESLVNNNFDITHVYNPLNYLSINELFNCRSYLDHWYLNGAKEILKPEPEEMTLEEICKALGKEVKIVKEK